MHRRMVVRRIIPEPAIAGRFLSFLFSMTRKPNRILIVSYIYPPRNGPGGERAAHLARFLSERGYAVTVINRDLTE